MESQVLRPPRGALWAMLSEKFTFHLALADGKTNTLYTYE